MSENTLEKPAASLLFEAIQGLIKPMSKTELREFFGIKSHTLELYNGKGLPRFMVGKEVRYYLPDVLDWFRQRGIDKLEQEFELE